VSPGIEPGHTGRRIPARATARVVPVLAGAALVLAATVRAAAPAAAAPPPATAPPSAADVIVRPIPRPEVDTTHGYAEYRFTVRNTSPDHAHRVTLTLPGGSNFGGLLRRVSRSVRVGPDTSMTVSLFQLPMYMDGVGAGVYVDGEQGEGVHLSFPSHGVGYYHGDPDEIKRVVLVSREAGRAGSLNDRDHIKHQEARNDVRSWSPNWLAYSCWDGVAVTAREVDRMPPGVRLALARYVESGGTMLVLGEPQRPLALAGGGGPAEDGRYAAFGRCLHATDAGRAATEAGFYGSVEKTYKPWADLSDTLDAHRRFPVVESISVPVRGMLLLMLLFVVLIGPVNLFVLARKRRRIWLFVTVPAASLVTCGLVFAYSIFSEGIRGRYRTLSVTVLDETVSRATTLGWMAFYSPLTPHGGLHFPRQTELTPQIYDYWDFAHSYHRPPDADVSRTVHLTEDQHLAAGWVRARVPAAFKFRRCEDRRERLTVRRDAGGGVRVVNGLGVRIERLVLADEKGALHRAEAIAPGAEAALEPRPGRCRRKPFRALYTQDWITAARAVRASPSAYLRPGTYVAFLEESPFVERPLAGAAARQHEAVVLGISRGGEHAGSR